MGKNGFYFLLPWRLLVLTVSWKNLKIFVLSFTANIFFSLLFSQKRTHYKSVPPNVHRYNKTIDIKELSPNSTMKIFTNGTHNFTIMEEELAPGSDLVPAGLEIAARNMNVLGLVVFSIVFGIVLGRVGDRGLPVKAFFESLNEIIMEMIALVMW